MRTIGLDGCRIGWLSVEFAQGGQCCAVVYRDIDAAWGAWTRKGCVHLALIDIPIGLREDGPEQRLCEQEARRLLGARHSSVFTPPVRSALRASTYLEASRLNHALTGRRLSKQCWGIAPKIREVDDFFAGTPAAQTVLRETHPELLFLKLNGGRPLAHSKKTRDGFRQRLELITEHFPPAQSIVADLRSRYRKREVADDDILDAMVAAVAARRCIERGEIQSVPGAPEYDARGLRMEMVYFAP